MSNLLKKYSLKSEDKVHNAAPAESIFIKSLHDEASQNPFQKLLDSTKMATTNKTNGSLNQYYKIYINRLQHFRPQLKQEASQKFSSKSTFYPKILDIQPTVLSQAIEKEQDISTLDPISLCWSIGTTYTEMKYKPDILNQVSQDLYGLPERPNNYVYSEDNDDSEDENREVLFEDESGRIILKFEHSNIDKEILVTGVSIAILGYVDGNNDLQVIDYCFPPKLQPAVNQQNRQQDSKILLLSGLDLCQNTDIDKLSNLQAYLSGAISSSSDFSNNLVILGDSLLSYNNLTIFNEFLTTIIKSKTITLIPSLNDPSERLLPQKPINVKLFDRLIQLNASAVLSLQTNPTYWDKFKVFLEAGDSINDIVKYGNYDNTNDRVKIMQNFIKWQNLAPTAPDTLNMPSFDINGSDDPFILKEEYPRALILGNQPSFIQSSYENVELIGVPKFSTTGQLLQLDLNNFDHKLIQL